MEWKEFTEELKRAFREITKYYRFMKQSYDCFGDNNKYDYKNVQLRGDDVPVEIICPEHGSFWVTPVQHVHGCGCPKCEMLKRGTPFADESLLAFALAQQNTLNWIEDELVNITGVSVDALKESYRSYTKDEKENGTLGL